MTVMAGSDLPQASPTLARVLESAARLQELVPDAVLVGGSAAALHAGHRHASSHDHVLADLGKRFEAVLDALESEGDWVTNRVTPGKIILGELGGIETGVRQLIRRRPLETTEVVLPDGGDRVTAPTIEEALRVKAFLVVRRNRTRDYLDVAALADRFGIERAGAVLAGLDGYYSDQHHEGDGVASQVARQLAEPRPADPTVTRQLDRYKNLESRWHDWAVVVGVCRQVAAAILGP